MITNYSNYFSKYRVSLIHKTILIHGITASCWMESAPRPRHKIQIGAAIILLRSEQLLNFFKKL